MANKLADYIIGKLGLDKAAKQGAPVPQPKQTASANIDMGKLAQESADRAKAAESTKQAAPAKTKLPQYKQGGMVKRTGPAMVHKGERVLTAKQARCR